jgi:hypothetical protein
MFALFACHSLEGENPLWLRRWIPTIVYPRAGRGRYDNFSGARFSANIVITSGHFSEISLALWLSPILSLR